MPCLCAGRGLARRYSFLPDTPSGPCGGRSCSLGRGFEELAFFLGQWGAPGKAEEKLICFPFFLNSIQHVYGAQHPPFDPLLHGT